MSLPDGVFPRLNASMVHSGKYNNSIASVIGKSISFDGASTLEFECVDGGKVQVQVNPEFNFVPGRVMEVMGSVQEDGSIQYFIDRDLGEGFDFANYNQLITKVLNNQKYDDLFGISA